MTSISSGTDRHSHEDLWRLLFYFLRPRWKLYVAVGALSIMVSLLDTVTLAIILPLFSFLFGGSAGSSAGEAVVSWLSRLITMVPIEDKVVSAALLLTACAAAKFVLALATEYMAAYATGRTLYETKQEVLNRYYRLPYPFFLEQRQGDLKHVALMSTQRVSHCLWLLASATTEGFKVIAILVLLALVSGTITLGVMAGALILYFVISVCFQKMAHTQGRLYMIRQMEMMNLMDEMLAGLKSILLFDVFRQWIDRFGSASQAQMRHIIQQRLILNMPRNILETGIMLGFLGFILGIYWLAPGRGVEQIPLMGLVGMAVMKLWPSLYYVNRVRLDLVSQLPDIRLVHNVLTGALAEARHGGTPFRELRNAIAFDEVIFGYADREPVLRGLSMVVPKDKVTAVVGRSGEGKTTIINLLLGLYEPHSGSILVDGVPLGRIDLKDWRARIGVVPHDPFLFHGTIADNVSFGDESFTRDEIEAAGRIALVDEIVEKLQDGYDTIVGDRGAKLSAGQQQRIAIARAVLRDPQILIFDEATSSLDTISEKLVQEAIARTSQNRTVMLIAHRLSTIRHADKIIVVQEGRTAEEGTHDELARGVGVYSQLVHAAAFHGLEQGT